MNRHPNGDRLTTSDLIDIARGAGLDAKVHKILSANHGDNRTHSDLIDATRDVRFSLFMAGRLVLNTRTAANS